MKEIGMLFKGPLVLDILADRKTQTRRKITPRNTFFDGGTWPKDIELDWANVVMARSSGFGRGPELLISAHGGGMYRITPRIQVGDHIHVIGEEAHHPVETAPIPSRITLEVTEIRMPRIQDISPEDAEAEGIEGSSHASPANGLPYEIYKAGGVEFGTPVEAFGGLWDSINGDDPGHSWLDNRNVIAYTFKRINNESEGK